MEVCVDTIESAVNAERGGASRLELCNALSEGGLTPSAGLIKKVKELVRVPIYVMIRPRIGDFVYSDDEIDIMKYDIVNAKQHGADGIVFGVLNIDGTVNKVQCKVLVQVAKPLRCTFHRAFDMTSDPVQALEDIVELGFERILTSGQQISAEKGMNLIKQLNTLASDRIIIMAGSGVNAGNIGKILRTTGVKEYHASARSKVTSSMKFQNEKCSMGQDGEEFARFVTNADVVKNVIKEAKKEI